MGNRCRDREDLSWLGMMIGRAFGTCKRPALVHVIEHSAVMARGDESKVSYVVRRLTITIDSDDLARHGGRSGEAATVGEGNRSPSLSRSSASDSDHEQGQAAEWVFYQIDDMGPEAHISLVYVPYAMAALFCEGV